MFASWVEEPADVALLQPMPPCFGSLGLLTPEKLGESCQMLIGVKQIHDVHGTGEMGLANRVVVTSPVGQHHHGLGLFQTPTQSLGL